MSRLDADDLLAINRCCDAFEEALRQWRDSDRTDHPKTEDFLGELPEALHGEATEQMVPIEMEYRAGCGETLLVAEFEKRFPKTRPGYFATLLQESLSDTDGRRGDQTAPALGADEDSRLSLTPGGATEIDDAAPTQLGQYEIAGKIGGGGMGTVYHAVHRSMQREVAIKVMRSDLGNQDALRKRFRREVLAAAKLSHPNVVTAYDAGEMDGRPYLVTELVDGIDLRKHVGQRGPMPWQEAVRCVRDVARGLKYAHDNDVVHRDIKPANLLLEKGGTVKILDLGLARLGLDQDQDNDDSDATAPLTQSGAVMGTASYMAPEQARNTRAADARSDIYSLGCVLYFLVSGRPPYQGESVVDTILAHATAPIPALEVSEPIPAQLTQLANQMMAKEPAQRPQTMDAVLEKLDALSDGANESGPVLPQIEQPSKPERSNPSRQSQRNFIWIAGACFALGVAGVVFVVTRGDRSDEVPVRVSAGESVLPSAQSNNRALVFRGNGYVHVPSIDFGPGDQVTLEMFARLDRVHVANPVCWLGPNWMTLFHNGQWGVGRLQQGRSLFAVSNEPTRDLSGSWQHIAGTWDGENLRLFVDGKFVRQSPIRFQLSETEPGLFVGGVDPTRLPRGENDRFFIGAIDAVRISQEVVYPDETRFTPPSSLDKTDATLVLLQFDDEPGSDLFRDSSGNGHDGIGRNTESISVD